MISEKLIALLGFKTTGEAECARVSMGGSVNSSNASPERIEAAVRQGTTEAIACSLAVTGPGPASA
jgi:hypothetical protein